MQNKVEIKRQTIESIFEDEFSSSKIKYFNFENIFQKVVNLSKVN